MGALVRASIALGAVLLAASPAVQAAPSAPVCMSKAMPGGQNARLNIFVPLQSRADMISRGFVEEACQGREAKLAEYRAALCAYAQRNDPGFQTAFTRTTGVSAAELCAFANQLAGQ